MNAVDAVDVVDVVDAHVSLVCFIMGLERKGRAIGKTLMPSIVISFDGVSLYAVVRTSTLMLLQRQCESNESNEWRVLVQVPP